MNTSKKDEGEKFLQGGTPASLTAVPPLAPCKKKQLRYVADPHIEPYKKKGYTYYRYRRGIDPPEHLGGADFIRRAVTFYRQQGGK